MSAQASRDDLLPRYRAGAAALRTAIAGMSREQILARPIAGCWSTLEVLCHLADFEGIFAERIKRMLAEDEPTLLTADHKLFLTGLAYEERDAEEELAAIDATRRQLARILEANPPAALSRGGIHTTEGPVTVATVLTWAIDHVDHHLPFIGEKRRALGLMG